jgi:hypothetical protein
MKLTKNQEVREVPLPFSDGLLSAKLWKVKNRFVASVPELGLSCYGESDTEASFRLFTALLKYYRQLKAHKEKLGEKGTQSPRNIEQVDGRNREAHVWRRCCDQLALERKQPGQLVLPPPTPALKLKTIQKVIFGSAKPRSLITMSSFILCKPDSKPTGYWWGLSSRIMDG